MHDEYTKCSSGSYLSTSSTTPLLGLVEAHGPLNADGPTGPSLPLLLEVAAALFTFDFELARGLAAREPSAQLPRMVLVRALASAWLERPSDAVIQARALKVGFGHGPWPQARLALVLEARAPGAGAGEAEVRAFATTWRDQGGDAAIAALIAALEARLR